MNLVTEFPAPPSRLDECFQVEASAHTTRTWLENQTGEVFDVVTLYRRQAGRVIQVWMIRRAEA